MSTSERPLRHYTLLTPTIVPFRFRGLDAIGIIFFLLNIVLFLINVVMISLRFYCHPETFVASIMHPTERLYFPASVVSFGTILINISQYGPSHSGHWLNSAVTVLFWFDCALAILSSMVVYVLMWVSTVSSSELWLIGIGGALKASQ